MTTPDDEQDIFHRIKFPVSMAFAPDGEILVTERMTGDVWAIRGNQGETIKAVPTVKTDFYSEVGLLGIALHPKYADNRLIYVYYSHQMGGEHVSNRIIRFHRDTGKQQVIIGDLPASFVHNGGIIAFGPDGKLWAGVGENHISELAQIKESLGGKVLRWNDDGSIPDDNPFHGSPVYSMGHRNIFGLAFHPKTGKLYITEEGPDRDDEINIIEKGGNYGWPVVTGKASRPEFIDPIHVYEQVVTPTQLAFYGEDLLVPNWNRGELHRMRLGGEKLDQVEGDTVVYTYRPWGLVGVFVSPNRDLYVTTPEGIEKITIDS